MDSVPPPDAGDGWTLEGSGELRRLDPAAAEHVAAEVRALAEERADDDVQTSDLAPRPPSTIEPLTGDELREAWNVLAPEDRLDALRVLDREEAEQFFMSLPAGDQTALLVQWPAGQRRQWMRLLEPDDAADVIQEADGEHKQALLALLDAPTRKEVSVLLAYAEDEAGGLMNTRYVHLRPTMTVDEAISYLRRQALGQVETIYYSFVMDPSHKLLGVVSFRDLFAAKPGVTIADIMETEVVRVAPDTDQETLSRVFAEHDLTVVPVVDDAGVMKGIVMVDDIVDVVQEAATEDAQKFGGMQALEQPYLQSPVPEMVKKRGVWLMVLAIGQTLTATVIAHFQGDIAKAALLAIFMPLVISSGGNAGSQASTLVIRAMALGEIRAGDWWRVVRREVIMGLALGFVLGAMGLLKVVLIPQGATAPWIMGLIVGSSLVCVVLFGTLLGAMLPFVLKKVGADPASASAPFVATISDVSGLMIYYTIANVLFAVG